MTSVLVAMSGGVDSSVAAALLKRAGYDVVGCTMRLLENGVETAISDACAVARTLGIPHHTFDFRDTFARDVVSPFCSDYLAGKTPNPCIACNRFIKFQALDARRAELGLDLLATGHYARRLYDERTGRYRLLRGLDPKKDQSYVLAFISQTQLARTVFPLGEMSKTEVRATAERLSLTSAKAAESQDICFVKGRNYANFIESHAHAKSECGPILSTDARELGKHAGLIHYTIGQRKGIGIAAREPLYVVAKDARTNSLVVGTRDELMVSEVNAKDASLVSLTFAEAAAHPIRGWAKTHYNQIPQACEASFEEDGSLHVVFDQPQVRPAPGQALVVYGGRANSLGGGTHAEEVIGAGIIA